MRLLDVMNEFLVVVGLKIGKLEALEYPIDLIRLDAKHHNDLNQV